MRTQRNVILLVLCFALQILPLHARARSKPTAVAPKATISVDASDAPRKIFHAKLNIGAQPGPLTLYYPKWLPGEHGPTGPIIDLAGLKFSANGQAIPWQRDLVDMYAIHLNVPSGASS